MPSADPRWVAFTLDGQEVRAPEGEHLADAAKRGDVEIPVFCYDPKLVEPVGACRMCEVEIEGMPKLQTACSTPVKDGMVVYTQTDRVKEAQNAIVEFLLVNHPLDCPVCDKGGECPLQDISYGWGPGKSRTLDIKRTFPKPIALSPLVAIDRERCILCYRCVRFSQEVSEDYQLTFLERGDHTLVGTFDGLPYTAPFSGNITELCPVGALTSHSYRFRARPWDIEQSGSVCTLCPSQCNISYTIRDETVERVLARDNEQVDNGWLCDLGRYSYQSIYSDERITQPLIRDGGFLRPASWERAIEVALAGLKKAGESSAAIVGGQTTNEEGYLLQRIFRHALGSSNIDSRRDGALDPGAARWLADPTRSASVEDIDDASVIVVAGTDLVNESPTIDLRVRKALRHFGAKLIVVHDAPTALDGGADVRLPLGAMLDGEAAALIDGAAQVVVLWGERCIVPPVDIESARYLEVPVGSNSRGLREVGCVPNMEPGLAAAVSPGMTAREARDAGVTAFYLLHCDPMRELPGKAKWGEALGNASCVVAHAAFHNESIEQHADVVFPAEAGSEKDGTMTHPDGRLQRVRPAVGHPGEVRMEWQLLVELGNRLGLDLNAHVTSAAIFSELSGEVAFYKGITLDDIGGRGLRWQERNQGPKNDSDISLAGNIGSSEAPGSAGLRLMTRPNLWARPEVDNSPVLEFLVARQQLLINPADAERLGVVDGEAIAVSNDGRTIEAIAQVTNRAPAGVTYIYEGTIENNANLLVDGGPIEVEVDKPAAVAR